MRRIVLTVVGLVAWTSALPAQARDESADRALARRLECEKAVKILTDARPDREHASWAYGKIVVCGDLAPLAIAAGLRTTKTESAADTFAFNAAWRLSDKRLLDAVQLLARNTRAPVAKRTDAIVLLGRYVSPEKILFPEAAAEPPGLVVGNVTDSEPFSGTQPITFADRVRAMDTIRLVGTDDPNPKVRKFAMLAANKLGFSSGPAR